MGCTATQITAGPKRTTDYLQDLKVVQTTFRTLKYDIPPSGPKSTADHPLLTAMSEGGSLTRPHLARPAPAHRCPEAPSPRVLPLLPHHCQSQSSSCTPTVTPPVSTPPGGAPLLLALLPQEQLTAPPPPSSAPGGRGQVWRRGVRPGPPMGPPAPRHRATTPRTLPPGPPVLQGVGPEMPGRISMHQPGHRGYRLS